MKKLSLLVPLLFIASCTTVPKYSRPGDKNVAIKLQNRSDVFTGNLIAVIYTVDSACVWKDQGQISIGNDRVENISVPLGKRIVISFHYHRSNFLLANDESLQQEFIFTPQSRQLYEFTLDLDSDSFELIAKAKSSDTQKENLIKSERELKCGDSR